MLVWILIGLIIVVITVFTEYGLLTQNFMLQLLMIFLLGLLMLVMGLDEFNKDEKDLDICV